MKRTVDLGQSSSTGALSLGSSGQQRGAMQRKLRPLSRPSPGSLPHSRSLTDFNRDKEVAFDMVDRQRRLGEKRAIRLPALYNQKFGDISQYGPLVRSPSCEEVPLLQSSAAWHRDRVQSVFETFDKKGMREASLVDLQTSFKPLNVPMDEKNFAKYVEKLLPAGADGVTDEEFVKFHQGVWEKQWRHVHSYAGDPSASDQGSTSPLLLQDGEQRLRRAFAKYSRNARMGGRDLPMLLMDLGIDPMPAEKLLPDGGEDLQYSYHEVVEFLNQYIVKSEAQRDQKLNR